MLLSLHGLLSCTFKFLCPFSVGQVRGWALYLQIRRVFPESRLEGPELMLWCSLSRREGCGAEREEHLGSESWDGKSILRFLETIIDMRLFQEYFRSNTTFLIQQNRCLFPACTLPLPHRCVPLCPVSPPPALLQSHRHGTQGLPPSGVISSELHLQRPSFQLSLYSWVPGVRT